MIYLIFAAAAAALAVCLAAGNNIFSITCHKLSTDRICKRSRLLLISDVHSKRVCGRVMRIMDRFQPECVLIAGDLWDRRTRDTGRSLALIAQLAARAQVIYTPGNHDYGHPEREHLFNALKKAGACVLRADTMILFDLEIAGFDRLGYGIFSQSMRRRKTDGFRVLLTHFPQYFSEEYAGFDVDLVLCGHAHGGQFRIPFLRRGIYSPGQGLFPKFSEGLHERDGVKMIVSRGIGNSSRFPLRLFNPPEAVVIDILPRRTKNGEYSDRHTA